MTKFATLSKAEDGYSVIAEADTAGAETLLRITSPNGETIDIPEHFLPSLYDIAPALASEVHKTKLEFQENLHHPLNGKNNLFTYQLSPRILCKHGDDPAIAGTPLLAWVKAFDIGADLTNTWDRASSKEIQVKKSGWKLSLRGEESVVIGFADWDDATGIQSLVDWMEDRESLEISSALINPERAQLRNAKIAGFKLAKDAPKMSIPVIRDMIKANNLAGSGVKGEEGRLAAFSIKMEKRSTPIAICVKVPFYPVGTKRHGKSYYQLDEHEIKECDKWRALEQTKWLKSFRKSLVGLKQGWRVVKLPNPSDYHYHSGEMSKRGTLWITRLSEKDWYQIEPVARDLISGFRINGSGF